MNETPEPPSFLAKLAVAAFGLLSATGAWIIVVGGGFHHSAGRRSADATFYAGETALLMAVLQGLSATLAVAWLFHQRFSLCTSLLIAASLVLGPIAAYVMIPW